jgi:hypothetical protein
VVAAHFVLPGHKAALKKSRGDDKDFASESRKVRLPIGGGNMVALAASSGKPVVLENPVGSKIFKRGAIAKEFKVTSIRFVPCRGGVLVIFSILFAPVCREFVRVRGMRTATCSLKQAMTSHRSTGSRMTTSCRLRLPISPH